MKRLSFDDAMKMYDMDFFDLAELADEKRKSLHGKKTYFNSNRHINPTNVNFAHTALVVKILINIQ